MEGSEVDSSEPASRPGSRCEGHEVGTETDRFVDERCRGTERRRTAESLGEERRKSEESVEEERKSVSEQNSSDETSISLVNKKRGSSEVRGVVGPGRGSREEAVIVVGQVEKEQRAGRKTMPVGGMVGAAADNTQGS